MIKIKVCKLSDLLNRSFLFLISFLIFFCFYQFLVKNRSWFSEDILFLSIQKNLCINAEETFVERMLSANLPISFVTRQDDIEKEFSKEEKNQNDLPSDGDAENAGKVERLEGSSQTENKLSVAHLLECQKISDGKYKVGDVTINDYTKRELDFGELEKSMFVTLEKDCKVLIYHTHTSESYMGKSEGSTKYHTEDIKSSVVSVGEALKEQLNQYGILVRQDTTQHDSPSYNGAYKSSLKTIENILKSENYDIIIDIHRDALASNTQYRPTAEIQGETVAKLMFVVGTDTSGLKHDHWIENLKFAVAFQQRANEMFPGLFRDIHLSTSRYNQHTSNKTLILEVGATGNTIEEACSAMRYFAQVLNAMRS